MKDTADDIVNDAEEILEVLIESRERDTGERDKVARDLLRRVHHIKAKAK